MSEPRPQSANGSQWMTPAQVDQRRFLPTFLLVICSCILVAIDGVGLWTVGRTVLSWSYPSVPGTIIQSEVVKSQDSQGEPTFRPHIVFQYLVDGRTLSGSRRTFLDIETNDRQRAIRITNRWPTGLQTPIYFLPNDPEVSVLTREISGDTLFLALFLLPFHLVLCAGWRWTIRQSRGGQQPLRQVGQQWHLSQTSGDPLAVGLIVAGLLSLITSLMIGANSWMDNLGLMYVVWTGVVIASIAAVWHTRAIMRDEPLVFLLDDEAGTATWPANGESPAFTISSHQIRKFEINERKPVGLNSDGISDFHVEVVFEDVPDQLSKRVVQTTTRMLQALTLAQWLEHWVHVRHGSEASVGHDSVVPGTL